MTFRLLYVMYGRMPTEKAHGYQMAKMCEAFADAGAEVELWHPELRQPDPALRGADVFDTYDLRRSFTVRSVPIPDVAAATGTRVPAAYRAAHLAQLYAWTRRVGRLAERGDFDLVYTRELMAFSRLSRLGLPTALETHRALGRRGRGMVRRALQDDPTTTVVTLTRFLSDLLVEAGVPGRRVLVAPDAVDLSRFDDLEPVEVLRERLDVPLRSFVVGYVGKARAVGEEKGVADLIRSMAILRRDPEHSGVFVLCVGGPDEAIPEYRELTKSLGLDEDDVRLVGHVPVREVADWIRVCDVVTIPFRWSDNAAYFTSPMKLFEYLAAGSAIIASDLPALREVLTDGENALLVPPQDPEAIAGAVRRLRGDEPLRERLSMRARQDSLRYTWSDRAERILAFARAARDSSPARGGQQRAVGGRLQWGWIAVVTALLVLLSVPRFAGYPLIHLSVRGRTVDLDGFQLLGIGIGAVALVSGRKLWTRTLSGLLLALTLVALGVVGHLIFVRGADETILLRGLFSAGVYVGFALGLDRALAARMRAVTLAQATLLFGSILAVSSIVELALVEFASGVLPAWREAILGSMATPALLSRGGVTLAGGIGVIRVGGIIGAPENLGLACAVTIPFLWLAPVPRLVRRCYVALLVATAVATASRSLIVALGLAALVLVLSLPEVRRRPRFLVLVGASVVLIAALVVMSPLGHRVDLHAITYEISWRLSNARILLRSATAGPWNIGLGSGLGWGVDAGSHFGSLLAGVLGGDALIAWALGGLLGIAVLAALFVTLVLRPADIAARRLHRATVAVYLCLFVGALALLEPISTLFFLAQSVGFVLLIVLAMTIEVGAWSRGGTDRTMITVPRREPGGAERPSSLESASPR